MERGHAGLEKLQETATSEWTHSRPHKETALPEDDRQAIVARERLQETASHPESRADGPRPPARTHKRLPQPRTIDNRSSQGGALELEQGRPAHHGESRHRPRFFQGRQGHRCVPIADAWQRAAGKDVEGEHVRGGQLPEGELHKLPNHCKQHGKLKHERAATEPEAQK